jgi:hypothetical protein
MSNAASNQASRAEESTARLNDASAEYRCRRFRQVLGDLGLAALLGQDWVRFENGKFAFAELDDRVADALLRGLEELADNGTASFSPSRAAVVRQALDELTETSPPVVQSPVINSAHIQLPA